MPRFMRRRGPDDRMEPVSGAVEPVALLDMGKRVSDTTHVARYGALLSDDFVACETVKARAIRQLPVHVMRKGESGPEVVDHPLSKCFHRPNAAMSWSDLVAWAILRRDVYGTAYIRVYRNPFTGDITELRPVLAAVSPYFDKQTGEVLYSAPQDAMNDEMLAREDDVIVLKTDIVKDGFRGVSVAETAAESIGLSIDLKRFYASLIENGNHFKGYLQTENELKPADLQAISDSLKRASGADSAGSIRIFDRGLTYHDVSAQLEGMNLVEQENHILACVCRACHVDRHHVYADDGASATTATGSDIDFVKHTVLPEVTAFEDALTPIIDRSKADGGGRDTGLYVKFNVDGLLRGDFSTRVEAYRTLVYSGIRTRKDICVMEDWPWLPGQDRLLQPTAYYEVDESGTPYVPAAPTEGTSGQSDGQSGIDEKAMSDAMRPLVDSARERVMKRVQADGATERTREFAHTVLDPVALACAKVGVLVDVDDEIDRMMEGSNA